MSFHLYEVSRIDKSRDRKYFTGYLRMTGMRGWEAATNRCRVSSQCDVTAVLAT